MPDSNSKNASSTETKKKNSATANRELSPVASTSTKPGNVTKTGASTSKDNNSKLAIAN